MNHWPETLTVMPPLPALAMGATVGRRRSHTVCIRDTCAFVQSQSSRHVVCVLKSNMVGLRNAQTCGFLRSRVHNRVIDHNYHRFNTCSCTTSRLRSRNISQKLRNRLNSMAHEQTRTAHPQARPWRTGCLQGGRVNGPGRPRGRGLP